MPVGLTKSGRIAQKTPIEILGKVFEISHYADELHFIPRYNIPPSTDILAVRLDEEGQRVLVGLKCGFVPHWAKDLTGPKPINARAETVAEKPMFRDAFKRHRCVVPVDAFYEWQAGAQGKQPFCIRCEDAVPFEIAGIWSRWHDKDMTLETVSLLVTAANELMAPIHAPMPVIVPPAAYGAWRGSGLLSPDDQKHLLDSPAPTGYVAYPVSQQVNKPEHDAPGLVQSVLPSMPRT